MSPLLTVKEVASVLKVAESTIYKWVADGFIPHVKLQKSVRFDEKELQVWREKLKVRGRSSRIPKNILTQDI